MKKLFILSGIVMILVACSTKSERTNLSQLQERAGMFYMVNSDKPFSGDVASYNNGRVEIEGKIENGLRVGTWTCYHANGQKKFQGDYKEGVKDGTWTYWKESGQQEGVETYKFGSLLSSEGATPSQAAADSLKKAAEVQAAPAAAPAAAAAPQKAVERRQQQPVAWEKLKGGPVKFLDGVPYTGPVVKYQKNGEKEFDGYFTEGKKTGKWNYYDKKGNLKNSKYY
ncbi:MAG: hypothetical protein NTU98_03745 [Bacteroidetes bacterium]|nr:hypothetical protein [Bacteroidota bacterium]